jgi:hypothetical protein
MQEKYYSPSKTYSARCARETGFALEKICELCIPRTKILYFHDSVGDPDPEPDPNPQDPHVFEPPGSGSGSTSQRYGSGSESFHFS